MRVQSPRAASGQPKAARHHFTTQHLFKMGEACFGILRFSDASLSVFVSLIIWLICIILIFGGIWSVLRREALWQKRLGLLALSVAGMTYIGPLMIGIFLDTDTPHLRYVIFQQPFLVILMVFGIHAILRLLPQPQNKQISWLKYTVLLPLPLLQIMITTSTLYAAPVRESWRNIAALTEVEDISLLMIDRGYGRGTPSAMVYELDPQRHVWIIYNAQGSCENLREYGSILIVESFHGTTKARMQDQGNLLERCGYILSKTGHKYSLYKHQD